MIENWTFEHSEYSEDTVELLSSWKKWHQLLNELINKYWQNIILQLRSNGRSPKEIDTILNW
jgi:hypothetical protein